MPDNHIIEPERVGLWAAVAFIIALLALVVSLVGMYRSSDQMSLTQLEILTLNKKIETLQKERSAPVAMPAPAAMPAMPASGEMQQEKK